MYQMQIFKSIFLQVSKFLQSCHALNSKCHYWWHIYQNLFISLWFINVWKEKQLQLRIFSAMEFPMHFWAYILYQFKIFCHPSYENISWKDLYLLETPSSLTKFFILLFLINLSVKISVIYYKETIFFSSSAINFAFRNF